MRACEGCRRRKIKCDAATTNTWPCSACIRLKLHCVRPNGYDGAADTQIYEPIRPEYETARVQDFHQHQQLPMHPHHMLNAPPKPNSSMYAPHAGAYSEAPSLYHPPQYVDHNAQPTHGMHYTTVPAPLGSIDHGYAPSNVFPTPPLQQAPRPESPPEVYSQDQYGQQDLSDLLGTLKLNEAGTGEFRQNSCELTSSDMTQAPYLSHKLRQRSHQEEEPMLPDDDDYKSSLPPLITGPGLKVRIPPELMLDDETALHYFDLYFTNVHPYVPVLDKSNFYRQWQTSRESISPLVLEAVFALAGRIADDPGEGQQWLALASRM